MTRRKKLTRKQKVWLAVWLSALGTAALVAIGIWVQAARDTDTEGVTGLTSKFAAAQVDAPPIRFRDVAADVGVAMRHGPGERTRRLPEDTGSGLAWGDVDGDGDFDLYVVNFGAPNRLFRNDGERFTDITDAAGVGDETGFGMGASFADYDADGDLDLYVTNHGANRLFRNEGHATFAEVASQAGVDDGRWSTGVAWGDYDRDGHLDLYVCNYVDYVIEDFGTLSKQASEFGAYSVPFTLNPNSFDAQPNALFRNKGDGTFEDVAEALLVDNADGRGFAATFCDLDGDGWLDLYVNNDVSPNRLYRNLGGSNGGAAFADIGFTTGTGDPRGSMGLSVAEMGSVVGTADGLPDLFITHWVAQENALYVSLINDRGKLEYRDKTRRVRLGEISLDTVGWGSALIDLDLDGRLDIAVANGSTLEDKQDPSKLVAEPVFLFWNTGDAFQNVAPDAGARLAERHCGRGLAAADYDGDGDVDLAISVNRGALMLLRNDTKTDGASLRLRLDASDALRFGARVEVAIDGRVHTRWFGADVSFCSQHAPELVYGVPEGAKLGKITVTWTDGTTSSVEDAAPGSVTISAR